MTEFAPVDLMFVPGDRPERFAKAFAMADGVCIDLEDAVAPARKADARAALKQWLQSADPDLDRLVVRIQSADTPAHTLDLDLLAGEYRPRAVMLPKAQDVTEISRIVAGLAAGVGLIALIETARGIRLAHEIAAVPGVTGLALGALDLAVDLDAVLTDADRDDFRRRLRLAAAEAGVACWDSPWPAISDVDGLRREAAKAAGLGYTGVLCIHPSQLAPVRSAFRPSAEAVAQARRVLASVTGDGATQLDGAMIDAPVIARARQTLARFERLSPREPQSMP